MREVPANAEAQAERRKPLLRIPHRLNVLGVKILVVAASAGNAASLVLNLGGFRLVTLPIDVAWFTVVYSVWLHHRLRPWCPYCRRWDDDGGIPEPSPDPVSAATC